MSVTRMVELKHIFLHRSLEELESLSSEISRAKDQSEEKCLELARRVLHRIHGTGATLGFTEVGQRAAELRSQLRAAPMPKALLLQSIRALASILREMLRNA
jgi:HPt (histidine-containing phosphotransfer) domain-containing protein